MTSENSILRRPIVAILASLRKYLQKAFLADFWSERQIIKIVKSALQYRDNVQIKNFFRHAGKEKQRVPSLRYWGPSDLTRSVEHVLESMKSTIGENSVHFLGEKWISVSKFTKSEYQYRL